MTRPEAELAARTMAGARRRVHIERGSSTAVGTNVEYRLAKVRERGLLHGDWLDCGCADGGYTVALAALGADTVVGIDVEPERIARARERSEGRPTVSYCCASADAMPFADASFDGVFLNEVLEHVEDEIATLREIRRVLRPGGHLVLISPNRWFPFEGHGARITKRTIDVPVPLVPWLPSRVTRRFIRARNYWPHELVELVRRAGLRVVDVSCVFPVFEVYRWLPARVIRWYRKALPALEQMPLVRRFGLSTFVVARKG